MPGTPGKLSPQVSLGYSSQGADGRVSNSNNQTSAIGEGFGYEPGYIERSYNSCVSDGRPTSPDQCWAFDNGTLMLAGHSGRLVENDDGTWRLSNDDGTRVARRPAPSTATTTVSTGSSPTVDGMTVPLRAQPAARLDRRQRGDQLGLDHARVRGRRR